MLEDGLLERFPRPDFALALHDDARTFRPARSDITPGYALANVDRVDITVYGKGGHGSAPHTTVDPDRHRRAHRARAADDRVARDGSRSIRPW